MASNYAQEKRMYAIFRTGGKQYKVQEGDVLRVEKLKANQGDTLKFTKVLLVVDGAHVEIGSPFLKDACITASIQAQGRSKKVNVIKFRRRKHHRRQAGHRQAYSELRIEEITLTGNLLSGASSASVTTKDDLKKITGVGPVLEGKLHDLGIYTFEEIAQFNPERVTEVDDLLNSTGRISRDQWIEQARALMLEKQ